MIAFLNHIADAMAEALSVALITASVLTGVVL